MNGRELKQKTLTKDTKAAQLKRDKITYSTKDIEQIILVQDRYKLKLSKKHLKTATEKDIDRAINIDQASARNLTQVKDRLKKGESLSNAEQKELKATGHCLTDNELELFKTLLNRDDYISTHTTSATVLKKIVSTEAKFLLDPIELKRRGITPHTSTPDFCGQQANIFFTFGTSSSSLPIFTRNSTNPETGKQDDYATVKLKLSQAYKENPELLRGLWSSGHIAHYQYAEKNIKSSSVFIGGTEFYWQYGLEDAFKQTPKRMKYLCFKRPNEEIIKLKFAIDDEIATGADLIPFFAYLFIERLRCLGGPVREYILKHPNDLQAINFLMERLFRADDFEIHIPTKLALESKQIEIMTPEKRKAMAEAVSNAAAEGSIDKLIGYQSQRYPMEGYFYEDPFLFDHSNPVELPIVRAIQNKQYKTVRWLIQNGCHQTEFSREGSKNLLLQDTNNVSTLAFCRIITALFELNDPAMLNLFLENGFDFNIYYRSQLKSLFTQQAEKTGLLTSTLSEEAKNLATADAGFLQVLTSIAKIPYSANHDVLIEKIFPLFDFYQENKNQHRIYEHIAGYGNPSILNKVIALNKPKEIDYPKLYAAACRAANVNMLAYLKKYRNQSKNLDYPGIIIKNISLGKLDAAEYILKESKQKANTLTDDTIRTLMDKIKEYSTADSEKIVRWLIDQGVFKSKTKQTIIVNGVISLNQLEYAKKLIEEYKIIPEDVYFDSALENNETEFCDYLLSKGGTLPQNPNFLDDAIDRNALKAVEWALKQGFKPPNDFFNTLIHKKVSEEMLQLISKHYTLISKDLSGEIKDTQLIKKYTNAYTLMTVGNYVTFDDLTLFDLLIDEDDKNTFKSSLIRNNLNRFLEPPKAFALTFCMLLNDKNDFTNADSEINKTYPLALYRSAIDSCNIPLLDFLANQYSFKPELFRLDLIKLLHDGVSSPFVPETITWLVERGVTINLVDAIQVIFHRMKHTTLGYDGRLLKNLCKLTAHLNQDQYRVFQSTLKSTIEQYGKQALVNAITFSSFTDESDLIRFLIAHGVPVNSIVELEDRFAFQKKHITPLEKACEINNMTIIKGLLEVGASPQVRSNEDKTCLHIACGDKEYKWGLFSSTDITPNDDVIELLLRHNAPVNVGKNSPLSIYLLNSPKPSIRIVNLFIEHKADLNYQKDGIPPLLAAVGDSNADTALIEHLLKNGASIVQKIENESIYNFVCKNRPDLKTLFDKYANRNQQPSSVVFVTAAPSDKAFAQSGTGDMDYTETIAHSCQELKKEQIVYLKPISDEKLFSEIRATTAKDQKPILHLILNVPSIGTLVKPESLTTFKSRDQGKVVVTAVEFAKYDLPLKRQMLNYLTRCNQVIFLDENDQAAALKFALEKGIQLPPSNVIPVPPTVPICHVPLNKRGGDIISFGMIRKGKGLAHVIKLAHLIHDSKDSAINGKKIIVAGSICKVQDDRMDRTLYDLMRAVYPTYAKRMVNKKPSELAVLLADIQKDPKTKPALPIEIHLNVDQSKLASLFARCKYSYLPSYRGLSLRLTSMMSSLFQFVTFAHEGLATPAMFKKDGEFFDAVELISYNSSKYEYSADTVFERIVTREKSPDLNAHTVKKTDELYMQYNPTAIALKHHAIYEMLSQKHVMTLSPTSIAAENPISSQQYSVNSNPSLLFTAKDSYKPVEKTGIENNNYVSIGSSTK